MTKSERHVPIQTPFCGINFVSIRVDGVDQYPLSQLPFDPTGNQGFPIPQKYIVQELQRLLGNDFQSHKQLTTLHPKAIDCVSHSMLSRIVLEVLLKKGSLFCAALLRASFETELKRANDYIRGVQQDEEIYQQWRDERAAGIKRRRMLTDALKAWIDLGNDLCYADVTIGCYEYCGVLDKFYEWRATHKTRASQIKRPFRSTLDEMALMDIRDWETSVAKRMNKTKCSPQAAISWVYDNM